LDPFLGELESALGKHPRYTSSTDELRALLIDYLGVLITHRRLAVWAQNDPTVEAHPDFGGRLHRISEHMVQAIVGRRPTVARRAAATAAIGSLWNPLRVLSERQLRRTQNTIIQVALTAHSPEQ
jgi:hypothetical protein